MKQDSSALQRKAFERKGVLVKINRDILWINLLASYLFQLPLCKLRMICKNTTKKETSFVIEDVSRRDLLEIFESAEENEESSTVLETFENAEEFANVEDEGPEFVDVTWNAGGTSSKLTSEIVATAQSVYGLETMMHLTCTNMPKEKIDIALKQAKECGGS
ncbi:16572_t:CDS:2 [Entrophospora sp. SA101]|nr:16572_t:CDS:2 [Entrophospora sp. SA101]